MPLDARLQHRLDRSLGAATEEARRLWQRLQRLIGMKLIPPESDFQAMELACYTLWLPAPAGRRAGQTNLRERCEQAAELLLGELADAAPEALLARTAELLRQLPHRSAAMPEARLLADALNLEDFGVTGLVAMAMNLARHGGGVAQVAENWEKRQQYGYWQAHLKEGFYFHFEPVRQIARQRLESACVAAGLLLTELKEDQAP